MTLNDIMAVILRYFRAGLYMYVVVVQKITFAISSPDDFLYNHSTDTDWMRNGSTEMVSSPQHKDLLTT